MRDRWGLTVQVVAATLIAALVSGVVTALVLLGQVRDAAIAQAQASLSRQADLVARSVEQGVTGPTRPLRLIPLLEQQGISAALLTADGRIPAVLTPDQAVDLLAGEPISAVNAAEDLQSDGGGGRRDRGDDGSVLVEGRPVADGAIVLSQPLTVAQQTEGDSRRRILFGVGVGLLTAAVVGGLLARRLTRPVRTAAAAANALAAGDRTVRVTAEGPAEVAELADALNGLSGALAVSEERQRQFLLSVSHELRTPLTAIRGYSEALADGAVPAEEIPAVAATMQSESDRLDRLVSDLLDLARLQADRFTVEPLPTDLAALGSAAGVVWADRCRAEEVAFATELPDGPLVVTTDATRLRQVIDNLLENALRVTPAGGPIVLAVRADGADAVIEVRDGGPGLTAEERAVAFERGVLNDRYRGVRPVGTGLGLALAAGLVGRLGGGIAVGDAPEGGARFTVRLPAGGGILAG